MSNDRFIYCISLFFLFFMFVVVSLFIFIFSLYFCFYFIFIFLRISHGTEEKQKFLSKYYLGNPEEGNPGKRNQKFKSKKMAITHFQNEKMIIKILMRNILRIVT